ncbi:MAG: autotransporter-associated beta strand repeat-containing protein, partial [Planctomycetaceae bacterium]
ALWSLQALAVTATWNGNGANNNWSTGGNWAGGVAPTGAGSGDTLVFGSGVNRPNTVNTTDNFVLASGTSLRFTNSTPYTLSGGSVLLNGNVVQTGASAITIANEVKLNGIRTFNQTSSGGSITISGPISNQSGAAGINKTGAGTLILSGNNTYTGDTTVTLGTMVVNGSNAASTFFVTPGATLRGTGSVGDAVVEGTIQSGTNGSTGILQVKSLAMQPDSTAQFTINDVGQGVGYNAIKSTGNVDFGNSFLVLNLNKNGLFPDYTSFKLFDAPSYSGNIAGIPNVTYGGQELTFNEQPNGSGRWVAYDAVSDQSLIFTTSNGTLTVVPEPSTIAMMGLGAGVIGMVGYRRRRTATTAAK